jgi:hypothetical protein
LIGAAIFLRVFVTMRARVGLFSNKDEPSRLGASVSIALTNRFPIRWAEEPAARNRRLLEIVFWLGLERQAIVLDGHLYSAAMIRS